MGIAKLFGYGVVGALVVTIAGGLLQGRQQAQEAERTAALTPEQREQAAKAQAAADQAKAEREIRFQEQAARLRGLKAATKNPASLVIESALLMPSGALCVQYRATNSFNAVVPGYHVFVKNKGSSSAADWSRHCAGKTGEDFRHARMAI